MLFSGCSCTRGSQSDVPVATGSNWLSWIHLNLDRIELEPAVKNSKFRMLTN